MIQAKYGILIFIVTLLFSISCNKLTDVEFDATYSANLACDVPPASRGEFSAEDEIDPLSHGEVAKYIDMIKDFHINEITANVSAISKDVKLLSADLDIYSETRKATWHIEDVNLVLNGNIVLENDNGQWDTVREILKEKQVFYVRITGHTDEGDVTFTIKVTITGKVTANPL